LNEPEDTLRNVPEESMYRLVAVVVQMFIFESVNVKLSLPSRRIGLVAALCTSATHPLDRMLMQAEKVMKYALHGFTL
jgi:hypothetical protein